MRHCREVIAGLGAVVVGRPFGVRAQQPISGQPRLGSTCPPVRAKPATQTPDVLTQVQAAVVPQLQVVQKEFELQADGYRNKKGGAAPQMR